MTKEINEINDDIAVAMFDPESEDFKFFKEKGYKTVVNLQTKEEEQNTSEDKEQQLSNDNGLTYIHQPVSKENMTAETVNDFRAILERAPKPAIIHCHSGKRSGAFVMMHIAREKGMSGEETIKQAEEMGFECDKAELKDFLISYIDNN